MALAEARNFSPIQRVQTDDEAHSASHSVTTEAFYPKVKRLTHEADKLSRLVEILRMNMAVTFLHRTS